MMSFSVDETLSIGFRSYGNQTWPIKWNAVSSRQLCGCTTSTLTKWLEKKLDGNYTRILRAILNKFWQQHPTRRQLYGHLPPITKTIQARRTRHAGHCWKSKDELISDVLLWTPAYGQVKAGRPSRTCIQQFCEDTGCSPEDLLEAMNDREEWRERVRDIRASGTTWWWWWWWCIWTFHISVNLYSCIMVIQHHVRTRPRCVVAKVLDCEFEVSEFKIRLRYYIHFRTWKK